ncbi:MAG: efflux RND transporter periplasmic adaptor subunit [Oleibacter sp.]|nr:efflux RND transporter periplasmic adaptor subunit [Thalassolituus sp.]
MQEKSRYIKPLIGIAAVAIVLVYVIYAFAPEPETTNKTTAIPDIPVFSVKPRDMAVPVYSRGRVQANKNIKVASQVSGLVIEVSDNLSTGKDVKAGDVLARIDQQPLVLDIAQKKADLAQSKLKLQETQAQARVARRQSGRYASDFGLFVPQLEFAEKQVEAAQASLDYAYRQLENSDIKAPVDGKIIETYIDRGDLLQSGAPVALIYDINQVQVRMPLNDKQLDLIGVSETDVNTGPKFLPEVTFTDYASGETWLGYLVRIDGRRDNNQLIYTIAEISGAQTISSSGRRILPGSFVEAEIRGVKRNDILMLPRDLVQPGDFVWLIDDNNTLKGTPLNILYRDREHIYTNTPIKKGQTIASGRFQRLSEGLTVNPIPTATVTGK